MTVTTPKAEFEALAADLGPAARDNSPTDKHFWCPSCNSVDNLHVWVDGDGLGVHCFGCGAGFSETRTALGRGAAPPKDMKAKRARIDTRRVVRRQVFKLRNIKGEFVVAHERLDFDDGDKTFRWPKGTDPAVVPLYGTEDIPTYDHAEPLVVVEGERVRDRMNEAGYQVVALAGGSSVQPAVSVLSVLSGFDVILWPDNDDPGRKVMDYVARVLTPMASNVRVVRWDAPRKGDDAADYLDAHTDLADADALLKAATPYTSDPDGWSGGTGVDVLDLLKRDYPPVRFVVPGILPEGSAILASNPKIGKSAMVYQLSAALSLGVDFLGEKLDRRPVLYYALEDGERRSKQRAAAALATRMPKRGFFEFRWAGPKLGEGLEAEIEAWLDEHEGGVIFIDTFQKVRSAQRGNTNAYQVDVAEFTVLQDIVRRRTGASIVLVLHLRKARDSDFLARVSGTLGITGSADTTIVLERERHREAAVMHVTGRDIGEQEIALSFDELRWTRDSARLPGVTPERQEVYDVIRDIGPAWPQGIAEEINSRGGDQTRNSVKKLVDALVADDWVRWTRQGYESTEVKFTRSKSRKSLLATELGRDSGTSVPAVPHAGGPRSALDQAHEVPHEVPPRARGTVGTGGTTGTGGTKGTTTTTATTPRGKGRER